MRKNGDKQKDDDTSDWMISPGFIWIRRMIGFCFILLHFVYALIIAQDHREANILFFVYV